MMAEVELEAEYRRHVGSLSHYASMLVGPDDAMDVVNEAVAGTLARRSLETVRDIRAYWFKAVTNTATSWHRSRFRRVARERRAADDASVHSDELWDLDGALRILGTLSVQQRAVVYFTYWADWDPEQVASTLDISTGTVRKQLGRARERLRKELHDD